MKRKIIKQDIEKINHLLNEVFNTGTYKCIERLGGLTNHTYRVTLENER